MTAEEKEITQTKPRITIPPGALAILPLRNTVLFPSTIMPLVVGRRNSLQVMLPTRTRRFSFTIGCCRKKGRARCPI